MKKEINMNTTLIKFLNEFDCEERKEINAGIEVYESKDGTVNLHADNITNNELEDVLQKTTTFEELEELDGTIGISVLSRKILDYKMVVRPITRNGWEDNETILVILLAPRQQSYIEPLFVVKENGSWGISASWDCGDYEWFNTYEEALQVFKQKGELWTSLQQNINKEGEEIFTCWLYCWNKEDKVYEVADCLETMEK